MGALLVPFSFLTIWEMTFSLPAATLAGLLNLLGNSRCLKNIKSILSFIINIIRSRNVDIESLYSTRSSDAVFHIYFGLYDGEILQSTSSVFKQTRFI